MDLLTKRDIFTSGLMIVEVNDLFLGSHKQTAAFQLLSFKD